jgi:hypothetical protein
VNTSVSNLEHEFNALTHSFYLCPLTPGELRQENAQHQISGASRRQVAVVTHSSVSVKHSKLQAESLQPVQRLVVERKYLQKRKAALQREAELIEGERAVLRDLKAAIHRDKRIVSFELDDLAEQRRALDAEREALRAREADLLRRADADAAALAGQHDARILAGARTGTLPPEYAASLAGVLVPCVGGWLEASVDCYVCFEPVDLDGPYPPAARWVACCAGASFACAACITRLRASHPHPLEAERTPALLAAAARARFGIRARPRSPSQPSHG